MERGHLPNSDVNRGHEPDRGRTPNIQHRTPSGSRRRPSMFGVRCWMFGVRLGGGSRVVLNPATLPPKARTRPDPRATFPFTNSPAGFRRTPMTPKHSFTRRHFLKNAAALSAAFGFPTIIPRSVLGAPGQLSPGNRITVGCIGVGGQGNGNLGGFLGDPRCQVLAVNDVDQRNRENTQRPRQRALQQQGLRRLQGLPRTGRPGRHRRDLAGHARPLARHPGHRRRQGRQGHLRREALQPRSAGRPRHGHTP